MIDEAQHQRIESDLKLESVSRWLSVITGVLLVGGGSFVLFQHLSNLGGKKGTFHSGPRNEIQKTYQNVIEQIQRQSGDAPWGAAKPVPGYEPGKPIDFSQILKGPDLSNIPKPPPPSFRPR
jgi:hypothetical protein